MNSSNELNSCKFASLLKARSKYAQENDKGKRLKNKTQTAHWTTFYEKWKMANQENTNMFRPLSVLTEDPGVTLNHKNDNSDKTPASIAYKSVIFV